jgi:UDP-N-acetyl-D-mannosaminuronate dehydrogenase
MKVGIVGLGYVRLPPATQFERPKCYGIGLDVV